jgi:uncharacterized Rossmann fold enzyme
MKLQDFNNRHEGETIYILGNGEELGQLTKEQLDALSNHTTIGVNYAHLIHTPTYMITGHFSHILYAQNFADIDNITSLFYQGDKSIMNEFKDDLKKLTPLEPKYFLNNKSIKIPRLITDKENYLIGASNIALSSSNLAYVMGAKKIVYIGFDQRNRLHFYDTNDDMKKELKENIDKINSKYRDSDELKDINRDYSKFLDNMLPPEKLRETHFFSPDISGCLKKMFDTFKGDGVEVISTKLDSKFVDNGATHIPLDELLLNS